MDDTKAPVDLNFPLVSGSSQLAKFQVLENLGHGTYGRVYKCRRKTDGELLVLKQIPFDGIPVHEQEETLNEAKVMSQVNNKSFIQFYESFIEAGQTPRLSTCIDLLRRSPVHCHGVCQRRRSWASTSGSWKVSSGAVLWF